MTSPIPNRNRRITNPKLSVDPMPKKLPSEITKGQQKPGNLRPAGLSDDKILRDMPITAKDLGKIKKYYGIK
jgi:hypothetical protein